jgi:hypothetical protein
MPVEGEEVVFNRLTHGGEFDTAWTRRFSRLTRQYRVQCRRRGYIFRAGQSHSGDGAGVERTATLRKSKY